MPINLMTTIGGSLLEGFFPKGWNLAALDEICGRKPETVAEPEEWWSKKFEAVSCETLADFDTMMGHEIALEIAAAKAEKKQIAFILPVGPMGMYRWAVFFLKAWNVRLVGLDKKVYAKMVAERIERLRASAQIKQQEEKPQIITGQEKPNATPQIIVAKS